MVLRPETAAPAAEEVFRRLAGPSDRFAGWVGATFLALADTLCRASAFWRVGELPVGLITAAAGGPFFLYLLRRRFRERI